MAEFWETAFRDKDMMWGDGPASSAIFARDYFLERNVRNVLIPGIGYGRNTKPFLDAGMTVTGIEISQTAIDIARNKVGLSCPIHHGSVSDMPFDDKMYDGIFCYALIHLLDADHRQKLIKDCYAQLAPGGDMIFVAVSTKSASFGQGTKIGPNRYEQHGGAQIFFYDDETMRREFEAYGLVKIRNDLGIDGKGPKMGMSFLVAIFEKDAVAK